ncbi:hypothetical protein SDC9_188361 [bioreactor metagenome]|uniref:Uncharacterized protein n=1 Tax=bioreactor metagenome TaxID=1076179 RepID=A0A645HP43_9ZZZZ
MADILRCVCIAVAVIPYPLLQTGVGRQTKVGWKERIVEA